MITGKGGRIICIAAKHHASWQGSTPKVVAIARIGRRAGSIDSIERGHADVPRRRQRQIARTRSDHAEDRKSVVKGKRGSVRGDRGGRRIIKKKKRVNSNH